MKVGDLVRQEDPDGGRTGIIVGIREYGDQWAGILGSFYILYSNGVDYAYDDELKVVNESR